MGLKTTNYTIEKYGLTLDTAYAQIKYLSCDMDGKITAIFAIQQDRETVHSLPSLKVMRYVFSVDKSLPIYEQAYNYAKAQPEFESWEDDIPEFVEEVSEDAD